MCGIIGYVGNKDAAPMLIEGLERLEYRGYDSVGIAVRNGFSIKIMKDKGKVGEVVPRIPLSSVSGSIGIGHTRWATHGIPSERNAHPHSDCNGKIVLVHNGTIENYLHLKEQLIEKGHRFSSDTDSEVIAHLVEEERKTKNMKEAFVNVLKKLHGSYALLMLSDNGGLYFARRNSPLVIGIGKGEMFCASDVTPMLQYTKEVMFVGEEEWGMLSPSSCEVYDLDGRRIDLKPKRINWTVEMAQKSGYPHFMLKEIHEQERSVRDALLVDVDSTKKMITEARNIHVVAAGTSYHAGLLFKHLASIQGKLCDAFISSEYPYVALPDKETLVLAITQSGETADTLQAVRFAKSKGAKVLSLTNVVGSTITTLSDCVLFLNAGPEIGVAATKTFTSQVVILYKLLVDDVSVIPDIIQKSLQEEDEIKKIAERMKYAKNVFFIGRGISCPVAMEGALKFKEITYIHAEAYAGGELKHGPISLLEDGVPVVVIAPEDDTYPKILGNIKECKARKAFVVAFSSNKDLEKECDILVEVPKTDRLFSPFASIVQSQLLAYYTSVLRGIDPDKPRNLAKSVTVE